jgi:hypothetical protein
VHGEGLIFDEAGVYTRPSFVPSDDEMVREKDKDPGTARQAENRRRKSTYAASPIDLVVSPAKEKNKKQRNGGTVKAD